MNSEHHFHRHHRFMAYSMVYMRAMEANPRRSPPLNRFPASQFRGESGAESDSKATIAWQTDCDIVRIGVCSIVVVREAHDSGGSAGPIHSYPM